MDDETIVMNLIKARRLITTAQNKIFQIEGRERLERQHVAAETGFRYSVSIAEAARLLKEQVVELESDVMR
jgi:phosphoribosyl-dephospho-CoA transferase